MISARRNASQKEDKLIIKDTLKQRFLHKVNRDVKSARNKSSLNDNDFMKLNVKKIDSFFQSRSLSALNSSSDVKKRRKIDEIKNLHFNQDQKIVATSKESSFFQSYLNSLKRKIITKSKNTESFSKIILFDEFTQQIKVKFNQSSTINETASKTSFIDADEESESKILLQFETRLISHDQLIVKVKEIYLELIMMKIRCINVDKKQFMKAQEKNSSRQTKLSNEQ